MKKILRNLLGKKLIVVGVEWDKINFSIEQEMEITVPGAEKQEKEKVLEIIVTRKRVIIRSAHYEAVYFVTAFKSITYARVWRIS